MSEEITKNGEDPKPLPTTTTQSLLADEYRTLREEIMKRVELRFQFINLTLISAGTLMAAGLQPDISPSILFVYPILAAALAAEWAHNSQALKRAANYVRDEIETKHVDLGLGWETYLTRKQPTPTYAFPGLGFISTVVIFVGTQLLALALGLLRLSSGHTITDLVLISSDLIAILFTLALTLTHTRVQR